MFEECHGGQHHRSDNWVTHVAVCLCMRCRIWYSDRLVLPLLCFSSQHASKKTRMMVDDRTRSRMSMQGVLLTLFRAAFVIYKLLLSSPSSLFVSFRSTGQRKIQIHGDFYPYVTTVYYVGLPGRRTGIQAVLKRACMLRRRTTTRTRTTCL